jgi:hypothetical protein
VVFFPSGFPTKKNPVHNAPLPPTRYQPRPYDSSRFYHPHNSGRVKIIKLIIIMFSPLPCHLVPLRLKYFPNTLFSNTVSLLSSINISHQLPHPNKITGKIIVLYIVIFNIFGYHTGRQHLLTL